MPAKSKKQQRYMAMVANDVIDGPEGLSKEEAKKMAKTKHDGLPEKVKESKTFKEFYYEKNNI